MTHIATNLYVRMMEHLISTWCRNRWTILFHFSSYCYSQVNTHASKQYTYTNI